MNKKLIILFLILIAPFYLFASTDFYINLLGEVPEKSPEVYIQSNFHYYDPDCIDPFFDYPKKISGSLDIYLNNFKLTATRLYQIEVEAFGYRTKGEDLFPFKKTSQNKLFLEGTSKNIGIKSLPFYALWDGQYLRISGKDWICEILLTITLI